MHRSRTTAVLAGSMWLLVPPACADRAVPGTSAEPTSGPPPVAATPTSTPPTSATPPG